MSTSNANPLDDSPRPVSASGRTLLAERRMHQTIIDAAPPPLNQDPMVARTHSAILDDIPEDTDVFHVLVRKPRVAEIIVTDAFVYEVDPEGSIRFMGRRESLMRP